MSTAYITQCQMVLEGRGSDSDSFFPHENFFNEFKLIHELDPSALSKIIMMSGTGSESAVKGMLWKLGYEMYDFHRDFKRGEREASCKRAEEVLPKLEYAWEMGEFKDYFANHTHQAAVARISNDRKTSNIALIEQILLAELTTEKSLVSGVL